MWRIFIDEPGGMSQYVVKREEDCAVSYAMNKNARKQVIEWATSSKVGDQFEWGGGMVVDVTGGIVS